MICQVEEVTRARDVSGGGWGRHDTLRQLTKLVAYYGILLVLCIITPRKN